MLEMHVHSRPQVESGITSERVRTGKRFHIGGTGTHVTYIGIKKQQLKLFKAE